MKAQWQITDIETGKSIKIGDEIELCDFCKQFFTGDEKWSRFEAEEMFSQIGEPNPMGIIKVVKK
jgi:hypothetical protein